MRPQTEPGISDLMRRPRRLSSTPRRARRSRWAVGELVFVDGLFAKSNARTPGLTQARVSGRRIVHGALPGRKPPHAIKTDDLAYSHPDSIVSPFRKVGDVAVVGHRATGTPEDLSREVRQALGEDVHRCNRAYETCLKDGDELWIFGYAKRYEIHINRRGEQYGPYSMAKVKELYAANQLLSTDLAWYPEVDEWKLLSEFIPSSPNVPITPEWQIVAKPNKGKWNPGIHVSTQSKEAQQEISSRVSKYCFGVGLVFAVLFIFCWLMTW